jgi:hypothetical protein
MAAASSLNHFPPIREIGKSALVGNRRPFFHEGGPPSRSVGRSGFFFLFSHPRRPYGAPRALQRPPNPRINGGRAGGSTRRSRVQAESVDAG